MTGQKYLRLILLLFPLLIGDVLLFNLLLSPVFALPQPCLFTWCDPIICFTNTNEYCTWYCPNHGHGECISVHLFESHCSGNIPNCRCESTWQIVCFDGFSQFLQCSEADISGQCWPLIQKNKSIYHLLKIMFGN